MVFYMTFIFLLSGVPHDSVFGRLVITMYIRRLSAILGSLHSDMALNITCMLIAHMCIYHWILTMS